MSPSLGQDDGVRRSATTSGAGLWNESRFEPIYPLTRIGNDMRGVERCRLGKHLSLIGKMETTKMQTSIYLRRAPLLLLAVLGGSLFGQDQPASVIADPNSSVSEEANSSAPPGGNRVFGVLPNYRTADASQEGTLLTAGQKLTIASKDSFDYPLVALSGVFAGVGQLTNQQPSFGQGLEGFGHRLATNYADQAMGSLFTEGLFPVMLHEDPRYFRRGTGSLGSRLGYAVTRVFITQKDSGGTRFDIRSGSATQARWRSRMLNIRTVGQTTTMRPSS